MEKRDKEQHLSPKVLGLMYREALQQQQQQQQQQHTLEGGPWATAGQEGGGVDEEWEERAASAGWVVQLDLPASADLVARVAEVQDLKMTIGDGGATAAGPGLATAATALEPGALLGQMRADVGMLYMLYCAEVRLLAGQAAVASEAELAVGCSRQLHRPAGWRPVDQELQVLEECRCVWGGKGCVWGGLQAGGRVCMRVHVP